MIEFEVEQERASSMASIKVVGIGGAGGNTVNSMIESNFKDVEFIVANTDAQALSMSKAQHKIQLGVKLTKGLGAGANPDVGKRAAEEDLEKVLEAVGDADIVFLAAGMGGGTGSGATQVVARALREAGILTVAVVTRPFVFEGNRRARIAQECIEELRKNVDTMIVLPNQKLLEVVGNKVSMIEAFAMINGVLTDSVKGISDIITKPGHINVDFADLKAIMKDKGMAVMGTAKASGEKRATEAALNAISSPLLENMSIQGAKSVLLNITGGLDVGIFEINEAASVIYEQADPDANIILGTVIDHSLSNEISVTIVATGFDNPVVSERSESKGMSGAEKDCFTSPKVISEKESASIKEPKKEFENQLFSELKLPAEKLDLEDLDAPTFLRKQQEVKAE
ncbi:cell division protein FtsZ [candidate division TM6 bacterium RIFCSPHIGHO2_12_FULL_32_22]|nr:MAG: cell division protein FtsZ [candidate division TM6 bacterium RIFCSPHIGHO2_12_FULL_32_22]